MYRIKQGHVYDQGQATIADKENRFFNTWKEKATHSHGPARPMLRDGHWASKPDTPVSTVT